jgi:hypothetical protein
MLYIYIRMDPLPSLSCIPAGTMFPGGKPPGGASANPGSSVQLWTVLDRVTEPTERVLSVQLCTVQYDTCTELYSVVWYLYRPAQRATVYLQKIHRISTEAHRIITVLVPKMQKLKSNSRYLLQWRVHY